jgi:hypothetical protein
MRGRDRYAINGVIGTAARGLVFALTGVLVIEAAVTYTPAKAGSIDKALLTLRNQPFGEVSADPGGGRLGHLWRVRLVRGAVAQRITREAAATIRRGPKFGRSVSSILTVTLAITGCSVSASGR